MLKAEHRPTESFPQLRQSTSRSPEPRVTGRSERTGCYGFLIDAGTSEPDSGSFVLLMSTAGPSSYTRV
jgi:hypothetical protein